MEAARMFASVRLAPLRPSVRPVAQRPWFRRRHCGRVMRFVCVQCYGLLTAVAAGLVSFGAAGALAQPAASVPLSAPSISTSDIQAELRAVEQAKDLPAEVKQKATDTLKQALTELTDAESWSAKAASFKAARSTAATDLKAVKAELDHPRGDTVPATTNPLSLDSLKQRLLQAENARTAAQREQADLEAKIKYRLDRFDEVRSLDAKAKAALADVEQHLEETPALSDTTDATLRANRLLLRARRARYLAESASYAEELPTYEATRELLRARLDLALQHVHLAEDDERRWKETIAERCRLDAEQKARDARWTVLTASPELTPLAKENERLAELRKAPDSPAAKYKSLEQDTAALNALRTRINNQFDLVKRLTELTDSSGQFLQRQRAELPDLAYHRTRVRKRESEITALKLNLLDLETNRSELSDLTLQTRTVLDSFSATADEGRRSELESAVRQLLETRRDYLDALIADNTRYMNALVLELDATERMLIQDTMAYADFISERILWIRNAPAISWTEFEHFGKTLATLLHAAHWQKVATVLADDWRQHPAINFFSVVGLVVWLSVQSRMRRRLRETGVLVAGSCAESIRPTLEALAYTVIRAAAWPAVLWYLGWRLTAPWELQGFTAVLSHALQVTARVWFMTACCQQIVRRQGLAEAHFRWNPVHVGRFRRNLRWLRLLGLPLVFVSVMFHHLNGVLTDPALGRLASIAALLMLTVFARRVMGPVQQSLATGADSTTSWKNLLYSWGCLAAVVAPLALAGLAAYGYYYTAIELKGRIQTTVWLGLSLMVLRAVLLRWLLVARSRLAIEQARQRRADARSEGATTAMASIGKPAAADLGAIDLSTVDVQMRRLLRGAMALGLLLGMGMIWADMLPAFKFLDHWPLWSYSEMTTVTTAPGQPQMAPTVEVRWITLREVILSLVILATTAIASRNLPGLLEIAWLQKLPLDAGQRYALVAVARYLTIVLGTVFAFRTIGIGWNNVQWLAAAMTVGLGFGLQEIFANFVSGLIILFERPMRIGDTVTVGNVSGTVSRIRARATTITDWDNKELIVPNREFITGQLVNWTLSDQILRLVLKVGVPYGCDPTQVECLLRARIDSHPLVLKKPEPTVLLAEFGATLLNFELRVYVSGTGHLLRVRHDLNLEIERALRDAGIEMSPPSADATLRTLLANTPLPVVGRSELRAAS